MAKNEFASLGDEPVEENIAMRTAKRNRTTRVFGMYVEGAEEKATAKALEDLLKENSVEKRAYTALVETLDGFREPDDNPRSRKKRRSTTRAVMEIEELWDKDGDLAGLGRQYMESKVTGSGRARPFRICTVCWSKAAYKCMHCPQRYCSIDCRNVHLETKCLKKIV
eukprot:TRINITY_DN42247_c0_g1_i1.p2 TRINITY_DN42247_c0_g1~~TRINITY_DN42247_c0_g1_i1.p2  ORF type:complete len:167 (+),score=17.51 TRINITY_DN42247_c0_g1_i1:144-644(+)